MPSQSSPTILVLKTWVGLDPEKKSGPKYGPEKSKVKKTLSLLFKKRRGKAVFYSLLFSGRYFGPNFPVRKVPDPKKISDQPEKLE